MEKIVLAGQEVSWEEAWQEGVTPWDAGDAPPALLDLLSEATDLPRGRALIPGCGSGYDAFALARAGYEVLALDIAPLAVERFKKLRDEAGLRVEQADARCVDFFSFAPEEPFSLIWDYTFLCAIPPTMREAWAEQMRRLVAPKGELVTLIYPVREMDDVGPPYAMSPQLVSDLLLPRFTQHALYPVKRSHPKRQGAEWMGRWRPRAVAE